MTAYLVRRFVQMPMVLLLVTAALFFIIRLLPGDPVYALAGDTGQGLDHAAMHTLRHKLGLDQPVPVQYVKWVGGLLHGDLGRSALSHQTVGPQIVHRIPTTMQLGLVALLVGVLIGIPAGVIAAVKRGTWVDAAATGVAMFGIAVPSFWLAMMFIWLFVVTLRWLPASGFVSIATSPSAALRYLTLPAAALGLTLSGSIMRYTRSSVLEVLNQDYIRTARAKGLVERRVIIRHALRNSLLPIVTIIGLQLGALLAGSVIIESMFAIPGLGRLAIDAIGGRDYPMLQGVVLLFTLIVLAVNLFTDMLYAVVDPRIKYA